MKISGSGQKVIWVPVLLTRLPLHHRPDGAAAGEALSPNEAIPPHLGVETDGEGVDHRDTDTVETTGNLISAGIELPAGVEGAEHRGQRRLARLGVAIDRDAPPVIHHPDPSIGEEGHVDLGAEPGHGLVDRVVDHLPDQMVEAARGPVDPMYIPGRRRTASRPSRTVMSLAS